MDTWDRMKTRSLFCLLSHLSSDGMLLFVFLGRTWVTSNTETHWRLFLTIGLNHTLSNVHTAFSFLLKLPWCVHVQAFTSSFFKWSYISEYTWIGIYVGILLLKEAMTLGVNGLGLDSWEGSEGGGRVGWNGINKVHIYEILNWFNFVKSKHAVGGHAGRANMCSGRSFSGQAVLASFISTYWRSLWPQS